MPDAPTSAFGHRGGMPDTDPLASAQRRVTELIARGRDREAAALATDLGAGLQSPSRPDHPTRHTRPPEGAPMDVLRELDLLGPALGGAAAGIRPDQLDNPTPCAQFTVRGVLEHMVTGATAFAAAFRGVAPAEPDLTDPLAAFGPAMGELMAAIQSPGALERSIATPMGDAPGADFARFVVLDGLVHGYDLATATGQEYTPDAELVADVTAFAAQALTGLRDGETFKDAVEPPPDATPIEALACLTGRTVR
jgi:uncharacterized protein (TIGR03086 family)